MYNYEFGKYNMNFIPKNVKIFKLDETYDCNYMKQARFYKVYAKFLSLNLFFY